MNRESQDLPNPDKGAQFYENKYAQLQILHLKKKAAKLALQLTPLQ